jgi:acyl dehydratase
MLRHSFGQRFPVALQCTTAVSAVATGAVARGNGLATSRSGACARNLRLALDHNGSNNTCRFHSTETDSLSTNVNDKDVGGGDGVSSVVPIIHGNLPRHSVESLLAVGQYAETERSYTRCDVSDFARLVRDGNPLHSLWEQERTSVTTSDLLPSVLEGHGLLFNRKMNAHGSSLKHDDTSTTTTTPVVVVHGMLVACLFTSIFGTIYPGAVYTQQSLDFKRPVYTDMVVVGRVTVQRMRAWKNGVLVTCDTTATTPKDGTVVVRGKATVWLPRGSQQ